MSSSPSTTFDPTIPYALDPQVALRPEPFGALAYHYGNRRLTFLRDPSYGAQLRITRLRPSGRGAQSWHRLHPKQEQQRRLYHWLLEHPEDLTAPQSPGACASCGSYDACRGGCMASKFFTGLPLDGPDPECVKGQAEPVLARVAEANVPDPGRGHSSWAPVRLSLKAPVGI